VADRGIRSLVHLQNSASTARVLNLLSTWVRHKDKPEYAAQPFFQNTRLNRDIFNDFEANLYTIENHPQTGDAAA
jgi:hypothetical protein